MKIKAAIIGSGFIGPVHLESIRRLGFVEVIAIAEATKELADQKADELSIPLAYSNIDELLANPEIQVVHNCTPNHLHAEINRKIILAGKHIFSEKPLCMDSKEAKELASLAKANGIVHGVSFVYRHFAMVQQAASMIANQSLGKILVVHGNYLQDWLLYDTDYNWRIEPEIGGKSRAIADIGSHWCDTIQYVTGKKITEVFADINIVHPIRKMSKVSQSTFTEHTATDYEEKVVNTEDSATVMIRFDDGTKGTFTVSQVSAGRKNHLTFEINGSIKSVNWNQENPQNLWIGYRDKANQILSDDPSLVNSDVKSSIHFPGGHNESWPDAFKNMLLNFYTFIADHKKIGKDSPNFATFFEGEYIMHIIDAILLSAKQQRWVKISEIN